MKLKRWCAAPPVLHLKRLFTCHSDSVATMQWSLAFSILWRFFLLFGSSTQVVVMQAHTDFSGFSRRARWHAVLGSLALIAMLVLAPVSVRASGDHDRAEQALHSGQVLPLSQVQESVLRQHPGQVLKVELEREHGRWLYEFKILQADGGIVKLEVDAQTAQVLQRKLKRKP